MPPPTIASPRTLLRRTARALFACLVAFGPAAFVHAPLLRGEGPLFRDVRHFYQPTERRQQLAWSEGRIPLWNDSEGLGFPEFAEPTAAVFYPGKLLFALPLPWGARWFLYFVAHAGVACFGARRFARACGLSPEAGLLAGAAYAASGELLFQSCNPVYLVGAAWLPWALAAAVDLRRTLRIKHAVLLAVAATLTLLGGDPQTVYHIGLLIVAAFAWEIVAAVSRSSARGLRRAFETPRSGSNVKSVDDWRARGRFAVLVLFAGALALGLSAVQVLPAIDWLRASDRAASVGDGFPAAIGERYDFSVGPWRWADFLLPQALGSPFPVQRRWAYAFFPEARIWTPSYYLGLVPILLLPAAIAASKTRRHIRLPLALALAALAFALGGFGLGWFAKEIAAYAGAKLDIDGPVGGPYWLLVQVAPLYDLFRYPAKWMPSATLGFAVAGAAGFDALRYSIGRNATRIAAGVVATLFAGALLATWLPQFRDAWFSLRIGADGTFGPWDAEGALGDLRGSLLHAIIAATVLPTAFFLGRGGIRRLAPLVALGLILLAALDPAVANRDLAPTGEYSVEPAATVDWPALDIEASGPLAMRYFRGNLDDLPNAIWEKSSSPDRLLELADWERSSYRPRLGSAEQGPPALRSSGSLEPADLSVFLSKWRDSHLTAKRPDADATIDQLEDLSVGILILPKGILPVRGELIQELTIGPTDSKLGVWKLPDARPRWSWTDDSAVVERATLALANGTELVLAPEESDALRPVSPYRWNDSTAIPGRLDVDFVSSDSQAVVMHYRTAQTSVLIWNDRYDPGWDGTELYRVKRIEIGDRPIGRASPGVRFLVVQGSGAMRFDYRPTSFMVGSVVSLATLGSLLVASTFGRIRRRRRPV